MKGLKRQRKGVVRDARTIAIALEGEESGEEFRYFSRIRETHQSSPGAVIRRLDAYANENELSAELDVLWLVFDIDTWPEAMLSDVAQLAIQKRYRLGVSNPCFELWLLLHFDELNPDALNWPENSKKRSQDAKRLLSEHRQSFGPQDSMLSALHRAVARAEQLVQSTPAGQRWPSFPGTQVHMIFVDLRSARLLPKD